MKLDYWNHPLIVKAIRVKYRGGRLFISASAYLVLLVAGGMMLHHYHAAMGIKDWGRVYFVAMIGVQFAISAMFAISATSSSMQTEVATRTLDFQRIASLKPLQILLGKAIGEPASSYMLAMTTLPIAVLCCTMGKVSLVSILVLYVTMATTTFMMACLGLQHSLDPASKGAQAGGIAGGVFFLMFTAGSVPLRFGTRGGFAEFISAFVGLFTPVLAIKGVAFEDSTIWTATMPVFDFEIPYAVLTPLAQLALAALALLFMTRRLTQPLLTPLSKLQSYVALLVLDGIWAALQFNALNLGEGLTGPAVRFAVGHTVLALLLVGRVTPNRESFQSWVWRLRGRRGLAADLLIGERTLNVLALPVYCTIGLVVFAAAVAAPVIWLRPELVAATRWPELTMAAVLSVLVILCYGLFHQVLTVAMGRGAGVTLLVALVIGLVGPWAFGAGFQLPVVSSLSPVATFIQLQENTQAMYPPAPFLIIYALGIAFWSWGLFGITRRLTRQVDRRLDSMGIRAPAAATS
jgi:hypothetical protein